MFATVLPAIVQLSPVALIPGSGVGGGQRDRAALHPDVVGAAAAVVAALEASVGAERKLVEGQPIGPDEPHALGDRRLPGAVGAEHDRCALRARSLRHQRVIGERSPALEQRAVAGGEPARSTRCTVRHGCAGRSRSSSQSPKGRRSRCAPRSSPGPPTVRGGTVRTRRARGGGRGGGDRERGDKRRRNPDPWKPSRTVLSGKGRRGDATARIGHNTELRPAKLRESAASAAPSAPVAGYPVGAARRLQVQRQPARGGGAAGDAVTGDHEALAGGAPRSDGDT